MKIFRVKPHVLAFYPLCIKIKGGLIRQIQSKDEEVEIRRYTIDLREFYKDKIKRTLLFIKP